MAVYIQPGMLTCDKKLLSLYHMRNNNNVDNINDNSDSYSNSNNDGDDINDKRQL